MMRVVPDIRRAQRMIARTALGMAGAVALLIGLDRWFPPPVIERGRHAVVVLARDGSPLRAFPDGHHVWRHPVTLDEVSSRYLEALIAYEDRTFWWHPGVNPLALARAAAQRIGHGRVVSGGSTLTMQVARLIEPIPRTLPGKLKQVVRAVQLELRYSKREILTLYLNYAPMGGVLEGVEAASRAYLGKPAQRLTHAEAALLAVLPQAPSLLRPDRNPEKARKARDKLLNRMREPWGRDLVEDAMREGAYSPAIRPPLLAPLLAERMRAEFSGRSRISTTIDVQVQSVVERLLQDRLNRLPPRVSLATLVMDNATLEVLAYAGSADFNDAERASQVDMVRALRSPGSSLKPFLYAFALDEGLIHSESLLADVPQSIAGYQPANFHQAFSGAVSASEALARSLNVPAVEVLDHLGATRFVSMLRRGGMTVSFARDAAPNLSVILGGAGVSLESLTAAYTSLARAGIAGKPRYTPGSAIREQRMMSEGAAFIIRSILESGSALNRAMTDGTGSEPRIAIKTGTSYGFRDAWAVGVSDRYTIGVWVGRPDGTPNPGHFGANVAAPLVSDIVAGLPSSAAPTPRVRPASVSQARICWPLGVRYSDETRHLCHEERIAWLLHDTAPPTFPDKLRSADPREIQLIKTSNGLRAYPECTSDPLERRETARWPTVLEAWVDPALRKRAIGPAWDPNCAPARDAARRMQIVGVTDGTTLSRAGARAPLLRLELRGHGGEAHWMVNGQWIARSAADRGFTHEFAAAGRYEITALDDHGRYDRISLSVR